MAIQAVSFDSGWPTGAVGTKLNSWDGAERKTEVKHDGTYGVRTSGRYANNYWRFPVTGQPLTSLSLSFWFAPKVTTIIQVHAWGSTATQWWHEFYLTNGQTVGISWYSTGWRMFVGRVNKSKDIAGIEGWQFVEMELKCHATAGYFRYRIAGGDWQLWEGDTLLSSEGIWGFRVQNQNNVIANPYCNLDTMTFDVLAEPATGRAHGPAVQCS